MPVIDALHDAPDFAIEPAAHLLAALAPEFPSDAVWLAVVDPGVGVLAPLITRRSARGCIAQRSISTRQPGTRSPLTCTVVRGGGDGKNCFHT